MVILPFRLMREWCNDPHNTLRCPNCFGSEYNVIEVPVIKALLRSHEELRELLQSGGQRAIPVAGRLKVGDQARNAGVYYEQK
jgi:hypothetical protein